MPLVLRLRKKATSPYHNHVLDDRLYAENTRSKYTQITSAINVIDSKINAAIKTGDVVQLQLLAGAGRRFVRFVPRDYAEYILEWETSE